MDVFHLILLAAMTEAIWETLKMVWQKDKLHPDVLGSLIIGVVSALSTGLNLFEFVHDLVKIAQGMRIPVSS